LFIPVFTCVDAVVVVVVVVVVVDDDDDDDDSSVGVDIDAVEFIR
jgi:hypothetical protein